MKTEELKIHGYTTHKKNTSNELHDGSSILIKTNTKHKITDDFISHVLQITVHTNTGPINISTTYLPPRRPFLPFPDFHKLASSSTPTYIMADLNKKHSILGNNFKNTVGRSLKRMINSGKLKHQEPAFATYITNTAQSTPDIILTNNKIYHNHIIETGTITPSDSIPIILTITATAIEAQVSTKYNLRKADWEHFKKQHKE